MKKLFVLILMVSVLMSAGTVLAEEATIMGTVQQVEDQFVLVTDDNMQVALEGVDLTAIVGQKVAVAGYLVEDGESKAMTVTSYEPAE